MKAMQSDEDMEEDIEETWVEDIRYEDEDYDGYYYEEDDGLEYKYVTPYGCIHPFTQTWLVS